MLNRFYKSATVVYFCFTDSIYVSARVSMVTFLEFKNIFSFLRKTSSLVSFDMVRVFLKMRPKLVARAQIEFSPLKLPFTMHCITLPQTGLAVYFG